MRTSEEKSTHSGFSTTIAGTHFGWRGILHRGIPHTSRSRVFDRMLLFLALVAVVWSAIEFQACRTMRRQIDQSLPAESLLKNGPVAPNRDSL
jgi:hypothetical protein